MIFSSKLAKLLWVANLGLFSKSELVAAEDETKENHDATSSMNYDSLRGAARSSIRDTNNEDGMLSTDSSSLICISTNDSMHFAWYRNGKVSTGSSDNLANKRTPYDFKLANGYGINDLITISSNDEMHFAYYKDGMVSAGDSSDLASKRRPYAFDLAAGYDVDDLVSISTNDAMHFAWYKNGKVSAGSSSHLSSKRNPYSYKLASGYTIDDLVAVSANDAMHFAWYEDMKVSAGDSSNLSSKRSPYTYRLATGYSLLQWFTNTIDVDYEMPTYPPDGTQVDQFYSTSYQNPTPATIQQTFAHSQTHTNSFEFHLQQTLTTGVSAEFSAKVPFVGSAKTTVSVELALEAGQKWTESEEDTYSVSTTINVPAHTSVEATWTVDMNTNVRIPFEVLMDVTAVLVDRALTSSELLTYIRQNGFEGEVVDTSQTNSLRVKLTGEFTGSYGMRSNVELKNLVMTPLSAE